MANKEIPVTTGWEADDITVQQDKGIIRVHLTNVDTDEEGFYNVQLKNKSLWADENEAVFDPSDPKRVNLDGQGYSDDFERMLRYIGHKIMIV